jgi:hypothetical protein
LVNQIKRAFSRVKWIIVASMYLLLVATVVLSLHPEISDRLFGYYVGNFRGSFFSAFLTLGSFLFTFKSFAILRLSSVFEMPQYQDRHIERLKNPDYKQRLIDPLANLSDSVYLAIIFSLVTSAAQLTLGLIPYWFSSLFCIWIGGLTATILGRTIKLLKINIDAWIEIESEKLEDQVSRRISQKSKKKIGAHQFPMRLYRCPLGRLGRIGGRRTELP